MAKRFTSDETAEIKLLKTLVRKTKSDEIVFRKYADNWYYGRVVNSRQRVEVRWYRSDNSMIRVYEAYINERDVNRRTKAQIDVKHTAVPVTDKIGTEKSKVTFQLFAEIRAQIVRNATKSL